MRSCNFAKIPADMVVNSVTEAKVTHRVPSSHTAVYHISSSRRNQLKLGDVVQFVVDYFKKNPWIDERGKPVKVKKFHLLDSMASLHKYIAIRDMPILKTPLIFDDANAEMLRMATREINADDTFNFDPRTIQWENYFKEIHIPGLVKYIFQEGRICE
ncbi:fatty acyl-CoA reductase 1-like [Lycium ferocissimum]|uniref:fatty acyl-CoA reductase 1-like n=1 Tax=Lycium ferocissimum TaxID=112874 RepID=UPI0028161EEE|nr:fatty acyl-CoA reductase 1-like [Lycium ferocissimum]